MNPAVAVAVIAAAVSALGWAINHILASRAERRKARLTARLAHVERQLSELYGPLVFLIHEGRAIFSDLLQSFGRNYVFVAGQPLPENELATWLFWVDLDLMPRNSKIQSILASNAHLIVGEELPASYVKFLDHHNSWKIHHERWKREGVKYQWHSKINYPMEFASEVVATFRHLMKTHAELIGAVGRA
jgi:hypothetical protein